MIAGLPITGIGGLFYLLLALFMPLIESVRLVRGRSSVAAWVVIGRQLLVQVGVLLAIGAQAALIHWLSPGTAKKSQEFLGMTQVDQLSQSQTAGLIAGSTLIALITLLVVSLCVYGLKVYFQVKRQWKAA
jgi:hypothetical protein